MTKKLILLLNRTLTNDDESCVSILENINKTQLSNTFDDIPFRER